MQHTSYLESKVLTSTPQRLHLMLIEGAMRFGRQADEAMRRGDITVADGLLVRALDIVGEMLAGVRGNKTDLNHRLVDVYWFLFRRISEAKINSDAEALADSLRILEYERQTWLLVCEKFGSGGGSVAAPHSKSFGMSDVRGKNAGVSWQA
jgi:flagellar protein FliS